MGHKKRRKPFYKQFLHLKQNIQNRSKLLRFKKQKWQSFKRNLEKQSTHYKQFKIKDQFQSIVSRFAGQGNSFKYKFRNNLLERRIFKLF